MTRKSYTTDFKREAASLVLDQGYSVRTACEAMDVGHTAMRRWVNQLRQEREGITPEKSKALTPEQQRIQELEARLRKVEREKEILKKSHRALDVGFAGKRQLINKLRAHYSVGELCEVLELPRSSYYYGLGFNS